MKWLVVEIMAMSINEGYKNPKMMNDSRRLDGSRMRIARAGCDWFHKGKDSNFPRRWLGDRGMVMTVKPINREEPKWSDGIAATLFVTKLL